MVTFAPRSTAPEGSVITPWILPVEMVVWARALCIVQISSQAAIQVIKHLQVLRDAFSFAMQCVSRSCVLESRWGRAQRSTSVLFRDSVGIACCRELLRI